MAHVLEVQGWQATHDAQPALLSSAARGAAGAADDAEKKLLPAGILEVRETVLLSPAAREAGTAQPVGTMQAGEGEVLLLELEDGSTLVTSVVQLRASLLRSRPDLVDGDRIRLDQLNAATAMPSRGLVADLGKAVVKRVIRAVLHGELDQGALLQDAGVQAVELGLSWAGTKALTSVLENKVMAGDDLLCAWDTTESGAGTPKPVEPEHFKDYDGKPLLVFVHGTASNTVGSFGELQSGERDVWAALRKAYPGGLYALEHHTLSRSPIENAIALAGALPRGARVSLVSHSRGGLVADLLCLRDFGALIAQYRRDPRQFQGTGSAEGERALPPASTLADEMDKAHGEQRAQLARLAELLADRQLTVERYVRVAAPANGTRLAGGNFDLFLSGILSLLGLNPWFFGNPLYAVFKRVVLEIAQRRTDPHMVPGIEAMLPDSPLARLLRQAPVQPGIAMGLIAGDAEGGTALSRLGLLLTDFLLFDQVDNDLVVDTPAMLAGIAARAGARALLERSRATTHFRYFANLDTRTALRDWLVSKEPRTLPAFVDLPPDEAALQERLQRALEGQTRAAAAAELPVVVLLPGIMGSSLRAKGDRIWLDPLRLLRGGLDRVAWGSEGVEAESPLALSYGELIEELARTHRVVAFAYDWRQPLDVLGERLGALLAQLLQQTQQPIRLLAHSMGGLVVRACIYRRRAVMDELMARADARLVMLGTPHQGSHTMVQNLLGKGGMLRALAAMDTRHSLEELLGIVAGFRGALQLLPRPGFVDEFQTEADALQRNFMLSTTWDDLKPTVKDFWFGDGRMAVPLQQALTEGGWLWSQDNGGQPRSEPPSLPAAYAPKAIYVFGVALNTTCGLVVENGRLKLQGTPRGDGTVTWASGRIGNVGQHYFMPAEHGNLCDTREHFSALAELLVKGSTAALAQTPPVTRAAEPQGPVVFDAGPPAVLSDAALINAAVGGKARTRIKPRPKRRLEVGVTATDLRFLTQPLLVGHYENDPIAGPEALIDRELLEGDLSRRRALGLYAGARGTATVVLRVSPLRPLGAGMVRGAVVTGLGRYEQPLSGTDLTDAVRAGVLRLLLQLADQLGAQVNGADAEYELPLATLLLGYNSNANLGVDSSVEALVRGVLEANARFHESTRLRLCVGRLDIVELYLDTAITAVYALRRLAQEGSRLSQLAQSQGTALVCRRTLRQGQGLRQRLFDNHSSAYWPRLMITGADDGAAGAPVPAPGAAAAPAPSRAAGIATRLRFVYVGQRARAETEMQQRQPGLVEALIRQQIASPVWNEDIGRMLFQLMVPHDFKEAGRQLQRVVLVLDEYTANMPWELMFAADAQAGGLAQAGPPPMALQMPMVRQLASAEYRRQVRPSVGHTALVVGNPSVQGFELAFLVNGRPAQPLPPLQGAEAEANAVAQVLTGLGYEVRTAIGADQRAVDVMAQLLRRPWRILHIAAHGVFDLAHVDGGRRSGVVLSDGLLITAAEISAMEWVPELVFLSCCHLGQVDGGAQRLRDANKLAASVARELMAIGVRCVVVAGWAVNDKLARDFGETFYKELLLHRQPFGEAVFRARQAIYQDGGGDITWGAYQAYGDADWRAEGMAEARAAGDGDTQVASPDELLDELASRRAALARRSEALTDAELKRQRDEIQDLLDKRCPPDWRHSPSLQSALGATWADLKHDDEARKAYLCAVQAEDQLGRVPIRDIEQLANVEARLGEKQKDKDLIRRALQRLDDLDRLVGQGRGEGEGEGQRSGALNAERGALRGGALKRLAVLHARDLLEASPVPSSAGKALERMLSDSAEAYRAGQGEPGQPGFRPYNALNGLALQALLLKAQPATAPAQAAQALELARVSEEEARRAFAAQADAWTALMPLEARVVQALLDGSLDQGEAAVPAREQLLQAYRAELARLMIKPRELDSVLSHLCQLSRLADALFLHSGVPALWHVAAHLLALAQGLKATDYRRADRAMAKPPADAAKDAAPAADPQESKAGTARGKKTVAAKKRAARGRGA
ncbi:CHAT domain-containing protein [Azohydromonas lata]|uniref:CHAT domain-containing protein n=1 Tax=Azohydromonas lata TaxID=45677 RepID=A0ABU5IP95_9BURK|nr:CHAT domain-containing protein [Azohydromonas lata]MDZ5460710.1 CHAT domain-containing protein [Azohydromonas lata]